MARPIAILGAAAAVLAMSGCGPAAVHSPTTSNGAGHAQARNREFTLSEQALDSKTPTDDGITLWAPPTSGEPWELRGVASGAQLLLYVRWPALRDLAEGRKILGCLAIIGLDPEAWLEEAWGLDRSGIQQVLAAWYPRDRGPPAVSVAVKLEAPWSHASSWRTVPIKEHAGFEHGRWRAIVLSEDFQHVVFTSDPQLFDEFASGSDGALRQGMARLHKHANRKWSLEVLGTTRFFQGDGRTLLAGLAALDGRQGLNMLMDDLESFLFSAWWDENLYLELRGLPRADVAPRKVKTDWADVINAVPDLIAAQVSAGRLSPSEAEVLRRWPRQLRLLAHYARTADDSRSVVMNVYLPEQAAHNLLLGGLLYLAEVGRRGNQLAGTAPAGDDADSLESLLARRMDFVVPAMELADLFQLFREESRLPVEIEWEYLTRAGVTKNHRAQCAHRNEAARAVLESLVEHASSQGRCALVIVPSTAENFGRVVVTTPERVATLQGGPGARSDAP